MLCEECGRNEATIHMESLGSDGVMRKRDVCLECMMKKRTQNFGNEFFKKHLFDMLGDVAERVREDVEHAKISCPVCGHTYGEFKQHGTVGCEHCYELFYEDIMDENSSISGERLFKTENADDANVEAPQDDTREKLKAQLKQAIEQEDYEQAARLRDSIKRLDAEAE